MTRLTEFIEAHGLKKNRIAEIAGVTPETVGRVAAGDGQPTLDTANAILRALRECTGKDVSIETFWPAPDPQPEKA